MCSHPRTLFHPYIHRKSRHLRIILMKTVCLERTCKHSYEHSEADAPGRDMGYLCNVPASGDFLEKARNSREIWKKFVIDVAASSIRHNMYSFHTSWDCNFEAIRVCYCLGSKYQIVVQSNIYFTDLFKLLQCGALILPKWSLFSLPEYWGTHVINTIMV